MQTLTEDGRRIVEAVAQRHGITTDAVYQLLVALAAGGGRQAQFNHPELGGMGQWSQGGMTMIGDMFNQPLKARVDALCSELSGLIQGKPPTAAQPEGPNQAAPKNRPARGARLFMATAPAVIWPEDLGAPSATGSQNDMHYGVFPQTRRLAIIRKGRITLYDTGDHLISGLAQQQGSDRSLTLTSQHGTVPLSELRAVSSGVPKPTRRVRVRTTPAKAAPAPASQGASPGQAAPVTPQTARPASVAPPKTSPPETTAAEPASPESSPAAATDDEIFSRIERLADLRKKDIITAEEFDAKKTELLARL